jgi:cytochrome c-type biogenesis protein CcmH
MSLTLLGSILVVASAAISVLLIFALRSDVARRDLLARLPLSCWRFGQGTARVWIVPAAAFLLVAGIGAAVSYLRDPSDAAGPGARSRSGSNGDMLARLEAYARSGGSEEPAHMAPTGKPLPDVSTMIERLAARLETAPDDIKGWRMLGWSYFNTARYEQAAAAYARALALDPNSAEIKVSYEQAKAKASETASSLPTPAAEAAPPHESNAAIRAMVDGLASRLESSPRDVDGWARLMRSRVVLGEREVAATAYRKALEVFKDDASAAGQITAAAIALGLKTE